jgi:hypothetical protein
MAGKDREGFPFWVLNILRIHADNYNARMALYFKGLI